MNKKLIPSTIIPENLYVERVADQQLRDVIEDMGRPGYILVARQMGKTNLLINAKRKLETENDIFIYIDLSNRFESDRECFRNIIDTILESNQEKLNSIAESIYDEREKKTIVAHREHARELRKILSKISGKLIINLDEIDSLTVADYSDKIFAQIRSVYFERINYKEYERLSYIISGVAEPSEIIKDKSISPFNIGQKLLLGDFTFQEYVNFIVKASFQWNERVISRVFHWANGNPRLTWEICSDLEDIMLMQGELNEECVDEVVRKLYLSKYDRPPIDHIRSLVQSDKELREAVIAINYDKADTLSDRIKSRLYLAGILGSNYEYGDVRIKNRIVEYALDETWLAEIDKIDKLSLTKADEYFQSKKYELASEIYSHIRNDSESLESQLASYKLGLCYFYLGDYRKAINCYKDRLYDKNGYRDLHIDQINTLGISHYQLREYEESLRYFGEIIAEKNNPYYYEALMNKAAALIKIDEVKNKPSAISLNEEVIKDFSNGKKVQPNAISGAYYNVAFLNEKLNSNISFDLYCKSSHVAISKNKIVPLIAAINICPDAVKELFPNIIDVLSSGEIKLDGKGHQTGLELTQTRLSELVYMLLANNSSSEVDQLLEVVKVHCLTDQSRYAELLLELAISSLTATHIVNSISICQKIISLDRDSSTPDSIFTANKYLSFLDPSNDSSHECYFKGFQNYIENSDLIDVALFERKILDCISRNELEKASKYCDMIINHEGLNSHRNCVKLLPILFRKINCLENQSRKLEQAEIVKQIIDSTEKEDLDYTYIKEDSLNVMREQVDTAIRVFGIYKQYVRNDKKYGRNEKVKVKYQDGREEYKKYKVVEESIEKGICRIIELA